MNNFNIFEDLGWGYFASLILSTVLMRIKNPNAKETNKYKEAYKISVGIFIITIIYSGIKYFFMNR